MKRRGNHQQIATLHPKKHPPPKVYIYILISYRLDLTMALWAITRSLHLRWTHRVDLGRCNSEPCPSVQCGLIISWFITPIIATITIKPTYCGYMHQLSYFGGPTLYRQLSGRSQSYLSIHGWGLHHGLLHFFVGS